MPVSKSNSGYLSTFSVGTSASPPVYTQIAESVSITIATFDVPDIDVTHLQSPNTTEEYVPGMLKPGNIEITGNYTGDASQIAAMKTYAQNQTILPWKHTAPMNSRTQVATTVGYGFVNHVSEGPYEANKKIEFKIGIRITGFPVTTVV